MTEYPDFHSWIYKWQIEKNEGKILKGIIPPRYLTSDKREKEIKKRVKEKNKLENETKSKFLYYKIKELTLHRSTFQSNEKKPFSEDVRTAYKWLILPYFDLLSELIHKFLFQEDFLKLFKISKEFDEFEISLDYFLYIQIKFKLKKSDHSKDDDNFYIIDNPIVKDKVFKLPIVRPTTWKGALRFSAIKVFEEEFDETNWKEKRSILVRLFGNEKDALENYLNKILADKLGKDVRSISEEFKKYIVEREYISKDVPSRSGRLFFYSTFFDRISLDVITPLSRDTKTPVKGRAPIYFEIVPENTEGIFRLFYYPFDLIARGEFDKIENEVKEDLEFLAKALKKMFHEIGFSAKKTSGFGTAKVVDVRVSCGERLKDKEKEYEEFMKNKLKNGVSDAK